MKSVIILMVVSLLFFSQCKKDTEGVEPADINIRVKNADVITIDAFIIGGNTLFYEDIAPGDTTEYQGWMYDSRPEIFEVQTARGTYGPVIYEYTPEYYKMEDGFYTIELDSLNTFEFIKD